MSHRAAMIASVVRSIVAPVSRMCPEECGIVTITDVEVSADFSVATVYVSALQHPENALQMFQKERKMLQSAVGDALKIHRVPMLRFRIDRRAERGERIERLLKESDSD